MMARLIIERGDEGGQRSGLGTGIAQRLTLQEGRVLGTATRWGTWPDPTIHLAPHMTFLVKVVQHDHHRRVGDGPGGAQLLKYDANRHRILAAPQALHHLSLQGTQRSNALLRSTHWSHVTVMVPIWPTATWKEHSY